MCSYMLNFATAGAKSASTKTHMLLKVKKKDSSYCFENVFAK